MIRSWKQKFADAFRGLREGFREGTSFRVHVLVALGVIGAAAVLGLSGIQWCLLLLCITIVFAAELFNTALEAIARAITRETNPQIRDALDIAAAAVLTTAVGSVAVGLIIFGHKAGQFFRLW
jgi:diacylglycerol kinase